MGNFISNNVVLPLSYYRLRQCEFSTLWTIHEDFRNDLLYIMENLNSDLLIKELSSHNIPNIEKYQHLKDDRKTLAWTLLDDLRRKEAVIGLWESLYVLQKNHDSPHLDAVLNELLQRGIALQEEIEADKYGYRLPKKLTDAQTCHKKHLYSIINKLVEKKLPGFTHYLNPIMVPIQDFRQRSENELIEIGLKHEEHLRKSQNKLHIFQNKIFRWCHHSRLVPRMVLVSGVPGVGKTTLMQKFAYDWTKGDLYQRFSFVFFFKFCDFNTFNKFSLDTMILHQYPHLEKQLSNIFNYPEKLLFIFDGLDECIHNIDFTSKGLCTCVTELTHYGQIIVSLVKKSLLNGCSVLITSRPTRLASIDCKVFQRIIEITGFSSGQRLKYFENFFPDPVLAEKAFNYVKQNDILYTFSYLPSYCWVICTILQVNLQPTSRYNQGSISIKTVTEQFATFIANVLSYHNMHKNSDLKFLQSIGWMAEYGIMNNRIFLDDQDLDSFHVDNKSVFLSSILIESGKPITYSFLHKTVQEFLSAFIHYIDYSPEKLQKSLREATYYTDGRGETFLRFLCGLSNSSNRSFLSGYMDKADKTSRDVVTWLRNFIQEKQRLVDSKDKKRHLLKIFSYLFETQNKALVLESLKSYRCCDLSKIHMSVPNCTALAFILENCTDIEELNLRWCSLDNNGLRCLAPVLHDLKDLRLSNNGLPDISCTQLALVVRNNPTLKILDLSWNNLSGPHIDDLMEALSSPDCGIEELRLANNNLPDTSCTQLASVVRNNPTLKILDLSWNNLSGPHVKDLMEALSSPGGKIEELRLGHNGLPDNFCIQLASVVKNNPTLKILDLSVNHLSGPHVKDLMEALSSPDGGIEELRLGHNGLPDNSCTQLASVVRNNPALKILDLSGNHLSGPHVKDLMEALSSPDGGIEELRLANNILPDNSCTQLAFVVRNNPALKILDLSGNCLSGPHFNDLMEALSSPDCGIEELRLVDTDLRDSSYIQLVSLIRNNKSLKILDLSGNRMSRPHFDDLTEALSSPGCGIEKFGMNLSEMPELEQI